MRRSQLLLALALVALTLAPLPALGDGDDLVETTEHLYIHNGAEGCADDSSLFLVYEQPTSGSNCGYIYGLPLNEADHHTGVGLFGGREYRTRPGFQAVLDTSRDLTGTVVVSSRTTVCASPAPPEVPCVPAGTGTGVGEVLVDLVATARVGTRTIQLGSTQVSTLVAPGETHYELPFSIEIPDSHDRSALSSVSFSVNPRGWHLHSGYVDASGLSFLEVPSLSPAEEIDEEA